MTGIYMRTLRFWSFLIISKIPTTIFKIYIIIYPRFSIIICVIITKCCFILTVCIFKFRFSIGFIKWCNIWSNAESFPWPFLYDFYDGGPTKLVSSGALVNSYGVVDSNLYKTCEFKNLTETNIILPGLMEARGILNWLNWIWQNLWQKLLHFRNMRYIRKLFDLFA